MVAQDHAVAVNRRMAAVGRAIRVAIRRLGVDCRCTIRVRERLVSMRNLDIEDTRAKLGIYTATGLLGNSPDGAIPLNLPPKGD